VKVETTSKATTASTNGRRAVNSSNSTASNVGYVASAPAESASSGALSGSITPAEGLAVVPLAGPAAWTLSTSAPVTSTLQCGATSVAVTTSFVVGAGDDCQLTLVPSDDAAPVTWELNPSP
jgi:hypothetical protein